MLSKRLSTQVTAIASVMMGFFLFGFFFFGFFVVDGRRVGPVVVDDEGRVVEVLVVVVGVACPQFVVLRAVIGSPLEHCILRTYDEYSMLLPLTFPSSHPTFA